jgi:hypothetical protein
MSLQSWKIKLPNARAHQTEWAVFVKKYGASEFDDVLLLQSTRI